MDETKDLNIPQNKKVKILGTIDLDSIIEERPEEKIAKDSPQIGDIIDVVISNINPQYGAFVEIPGCWETGLIKTYNLTWWNQDDFLKKITKGDKVKVKVINRLPDGKLVLSRKELIPKPENIEVGTILVGYVHSINEKGLVVTIYDEVRAFAPFGQLCSTNYVEGEQIKAVLIENDLVNKRRRLILSVIPLLKEFANAHRENEIVSCKYVKTVTVGNKLHTVVNLDDIKLEISYKRFIEPFSSQIKNNSLIKGTLLDFMYLGYNEENGHIKLDMHPIQEIKRQKIAEEIKANCSKGTIFDAEIKYVGVKGALAKLLVYDYSFFIQKEDLSINKVINASDEVFVGEKIQVTYMGETDGELSFKKLSVDKYDSALYELNLTDLLETMDIHTTRFSGKIIESNGNYFFIHSMTVSDNDVENGKLLVDPVNGKNLYVLVDPLIKDYVIPDHYYQFDLALANRTYRQKEGSPYIFHVSSSNVKQILNPYQESVELAFKQHTSPNTNTSVAKLLEEVGQNLYSSKKRMFFELLQNADDSASKNGVQVKIQLCEDYFVLTHNGFSFNQHDFESITSAANSTKSANKKKTGYKGIGFKSVFTNSHEVRIKSGGYNFAFDKSYDLYNHFEDFYFLVNDVKTPEAKEEFLHKYAKFHREFNGVKDIPWQLLPIWKDNANIQNSGSIFNRADNVAIALKMDSETLSEYGKAMEEIFSEPRFMLFLRNTKRIQLLKDKECLTIQKNSSDKEGIIDLVNSFKNNDYKDSYKIFKVENIEVNDEAFEEAGILIKRKERTNLHGEKENYYVKVDDEGNELSEVPGIPDRIASTTGTTISFALSLDKEGHISSIGKDELSLYAYLPMNEHRFKFPFFINADFIPKSDREGIQSDNPWNYFLFYTIGHSIVSMVASNASIEEQNYLELLPTQFFKSTTQDTSLLTEAFNRGYSEALASQAYIINDKERLVKSEDIILDTSKLSEYIGQEEFYRLTGIEKRLPNLNIKADVLTHEIFNVEQFSIDNFISKFRSNPERVRTWISFVSEATRKKFYEWLKSDENTIPLIAEIPAFQFGESWLSYSEIQKHDFYILTTIKLKPVTDILVKLGFMCSEDVLDTHPFADFLQPQDEKQLFEHISALDISSLSFNERLRLLKVVNEFENIGKETCAKWPLFRNNNGMFCPLNSMFAYDENMPSWLDDYMINKEEYDVYLNKLLVAKEDIYSLIIEKHIDSILDKVNISNVYNLFRANWQQSFTVSLIRKKVKNIIYVVEQSDSRTKNVYLQSLTSLPLASSEDYGNNSFEYRIISMVVSCPDSLGYIKSIITIDGTKLLSITLKNEFTINYEHKDYSFRLSDLLPSYNTSSLLDNVARKFGNIYGADQIFAQEEAAPESVYKELLQCLDYCNVNEYQFCFLLIYNKKRGRRSFLISNRIVLNINQFIQILNLCVKEGIGDILGSSDKCVVEI